MYFLDFLLTKIKLLLVDNDSFTLIVYMICIFFFPPTNPIFPHSCVQYSGPKTDCPTWPTKTYIIYWTSPP